MVSELLPNKLANSSTRAAPRKRGFVGAQIQGLPTLVFIGMDKEKPALRLEGLLPASAIKDVLVDLTAPKVGA